MVEDAPFVLFTEDTLRTFGLKTNSEKMIKQSKKKVFFFFFQSSGETWVKNSKQSNLNIYFDLLKFLGRVENLNHQDTFTWT